MDKQHTLSQDETLLNLLQEAVEEFGADVVVTKLTLKSQIWPDKYMPLNGQDYHSVMAFLTKPVELPPLKVSQAGGVGCRIRKLSV